MEKFFNNAGPQIAKDHYTLDPLQRVNLEELQDLIAQKRYFVLHAPRQTGKTTALYALMHHFNAGTQYRCVYVNVEPAQAYRDDATAVAQTCCDALAAAANTHLHDTGLRQALARWRQEGVGAGQLFHQSIAFLSQNDPQQPDNPRPLLLFIDEIDALIGDGLIAILRQLRAGYADRPHAFASSLILCGVRDVRDYRIHSSAQKEIITGGSAFNVKVESIRLGNFSQAEMNALYDQHTTETGQIFSAEARALAWHYTEGQPWLVNALGYEVTFKMKDLRLDRSLPITAEVMREAKERLVLSRAVHLDQLIDKLQEERVRRVMAPLVGSEDDLQDLRDDDKQYCLDLGLITVDTASTKGLRIANAIYKEVIPRELTDIAQTRLSASQPPLAWYKKPDGTIDLPKLLAAFQQFYREHSEHWLSGMAYREAGPQLLLQAYLQRVVNGGGYIEREYGLGTGRTDLYLRYPVGENPLQREVIELKVVRLKDGLKKAIDKGTEQTRRYMDQCGATHGHLVVFDARGRTSWAKRVYVKPLAADLTLWGC
ncbi:MAG: hypothetical protein U1D25_19110 [Hydrogenophaga sp.]|uniref:hypothetical protein n=1 Tax=Hydrogenophaga sp. TaxID=1904254 RepID=UPI00276CD797|nr:hypothetical protein [Hydrogenophaga sp.]MDP2418450.1 hypothetical protein [Hydrogenophaga sp.]MDZ4190197.1 hypothetical protein [Hydrogenophaga sp.]